MEKWVVPFSTVLSTPSGTLPKLPAVAVPMELPLALMSDARCLR